MTESLPEKVTVHQLPLAATPLVISTGRDSASLLGDMPTLRPLKVFPSAYQGGEFKLGISNERATCALFNNRSLISSYLWPPPE
jgi:hypothetical protein